MALPGPDMKVAVVGLWHLGSVTAACLASAGHDVVGIDFDSNVVARLADGQPPLFEPGLEELVRAGLGAGRLAFSTDPGGVAQAEVVWITFDTPVDDDDRADVEGVIWQIERLFPHLRSDTLMLISSQLPVGTTKRLESSYLSGGNRAKVSFAYSPENLRLGKAIEVFTKPDRVIAGVRSEEDGRRIRALLSPFTDRIETMSVESAEMTKHALNAFLATSVAFINEVASICELVGADAKEVERGLKTEARIGPKAYLSPGGAFAGGTLARDVAFLTSIAQQREQPVFLLSSVKQSNDAHRSWARRRLSEVFRKELNGKRIGIWGLTYKPGTDTLRRSSAVELCEWLAGQGARVTVHDPAIREIPAGFPAGVTRSDDPGSAVRDAEALVVSTEWPEYRQVSADAIVSAMKQPVVLDANRFLAKTLGGDPRIQYIGVGKAIP